MRYESSDDSPEAPTIIGMDEVAERYDAYWPTLRGLAMVMVSNRQHAEDFVQDGFERLQKAHNRGTQFHAETLNGLFRRVVINSIIGSRQTANRLTYVPLSSTSHDEDIEAESTAIAVNANGELENHFCGEVQAQEIFECLSPMERKVVKIMLDYPDSAQSELAQSLGVPMSTFRYYLDKARLSVRQLYKNQGLSAF